MDIFYDRLKYKLIETGYITVIDRIRIKEILREQKMSLTALQDESQLIKLGKISGVSAIIKGNYNGEYNENITEERIENEKKKTYYCLYTREGEYTRR